VWWEGGRGGFCFAIRADVKMAGEDDERTAVCSAMMGIRSYVVVDNGGRYTSEGLLLCQNDVRACNLNVVRVDAMR